MNSVYLGGIRFEMEMCYNTFQGIEGDSGLKSDVFGHIIDHSENWRYYRVIKL